MLEPGTNYSLQISQENKLGIVVRCSVLHNTVTFSMSPASTPSSSSCQMQSATAEPSASMDVLTDTSTSPTHYSSNLTTASVPSSLSNSLMPGMIVGIVLACLVVLAIVIFLGICWCRQRRNKRVWPNISNGEANGSLQPQYMRASGIRAHVEEHGYPDTPTPYQVSPLNSEDDLPSTLPAGASAPLQVSPRVSNEHDDRQDTRAAG